MKLTIPFRTTSLPNSTGSRTPRATFNNAVTGHAWNQSITVQFTNAGNLIARFLKSSPTGENARTTCKLCLIFSKNQFQHTSVSGFKPSALTLDVTLFMILSTPSASNKLGILPLESKSFKYTKKRSSLTCESVNRNVMPSSFTPAFINIFCKSSLKSFTLYV